MQSTNTFSYTVLLQGPVFSKHHINETCLRNMLLQPTTIHYIRPAHTPSLTNNFGEHIELDTKNATSSLMPLSQIDTTRVWLL